MDLIIKFKLPLLVHYDVQMHIYVCQQDAVRTFSPPWLCNDLIAKTFFLTGSHICTRKHYSNSTWQHILPPHKSPITCCPWHDYAQLFPAFPCFVIVCVVTTSPSSLSAITRYLRGNKTCILSNRLLPPHHNTEVGGGSRRWVTEREHRGVPALQQSFQRKDSSNFHFFRHSETTAGSLGRFESQSGDDDAPAIKKTPRRWPKPRGAAGPWANTQDNTQMKKGSSGRNRNDVQWHICETGSET